MRKWLSAFTLIELLVVIAIIAILAGLLLPALARAREESRRKACNSNLGQMVKAMTTYQEPNGDFFPANAQYQQSSNPTLTVAVTGNDIYSPMPSLALLYPAYIDNVKVFACPSTSDKPMIRVMYNFGSRWTTFGEPLATATLPADPGGKLAPLTSTNADGVQLAGYPNAWVGSEVKTDKKSSYLYDERSHFRDVGPGQAMACDADGQSWKDINGRRPAYGNPTDTLGLASGFPAPANSLGGYYNRLPRQPNHDSGQNVMYFDGHVKWADNVYASDDPKDNVFCPNGTRGPGAADGQWGIDTDAFLWDGTDSRTIQASDLN